MVTLSGLRRIMNAGYTLQAIGKATAGVSSTIITGITPKIAIFTATGEDAVDESD